MVTKSDTEDIVPRWSASIRTQLNISCAGTTLNGNALHLNIPAIKGSYDGTLDASGQGIAGTFSQGTPLPLNSEAREKLDSLPTSERRGGRRHRRINQRIFPRIHN